MGQSYGLFVPPDANNGSLQKLSSQPITTGRTEETKPNVRKVEISINQNN